MAPSAMPSAPRKLFGDGHAGPDPFDPLVDPTQQGEVPAEDPQGHRLVEADPAARATSCASVATGIDSSNRPVNMRMPAWWARIRARVADGGSVGASRSASATAAAAASRSPDSQRYQRSRSCSSAARPGSSRGSTMPTAARPCSTAASNSPIRTRGLGRSRMEFHATSASEPTLPAGMAATSCERSDVALVRLDPRVGAFRVQAGLQGGRERPGPVAGLVPVVRQLGRARGYRPPSWAPRGSDAQASRARA